MSVGRPSLATARSGLHRLQRGREGGSGEGGECALTLVSLQVYVCEELLWNVSEGMMGNLENASEAAWSASKLVRRFFCAVGEMGPLAGDCFSNPGLVRHVG